MSFVKRSGTHLTLNGNPWAFTGFNLPYQMHSGDSLSSALTSWGIYPKVCRMFCFQTYNIVGGLINFTSLDSILNTFNSYGVKVILVLGNNQHSVSNDDGALKDLTWWQGGYATQIQSTSSPAQITTYRDWVSQIVNRYKNNDTIAMWQLINEAQAINDDGTGSESSAQSAMQTFTNDVAAMVKSIDSNHLVSLGNVLGFNGGPAGQQWTGSEQFQLPPTTATVPGSDYQLLLANQYLDVGDYHDYGFPSLPMGIGSLGQIVTLPGALTVGAAVGKPIIVGECGIDWTSGATINPPISPNTVAHRMSLFSEKMRAMFEMGVAGFCIWSWRNNPQVSDGSDYGMEVGPSDPAIAKMVISNYISTTRMMGSSGHNRLI